jgi:uncharacterized CHY-type Zn-finger protein
MYKTICKESECANKDVPYYMPEINEIVICGGCKKELTAKEMTDTEYKKIFDYDPFAISLVNHEQF